MAVDALIVNMRRRGPGQMLGLDDARATMGAPNILDSLTGGDFSKLQGELGTLETLLKVSIAASVIAGIAALAMLLRRAR